jgi:transcriptional regulator with XRE-family HTH domain
MPRKPKRISDFDVKLGAAIKYRRQHPDVKLSQQALVDRTGIPLSNLQRREEGSNEVTVSELERIAAVLKTTPLALVQEALSRYGTVDDLIEEYVSEASPTVDPVEELPYIGRVDNVPERIAANTKDRTGPKE